MLDAIRNAAADRRGDLRIETVPAQSSSRGVLESERGIDHSLATELAGQEAVKESADEDRSRVSQAVVALEGEVSSNIISV